MTVSIPSIGWAHWVWMLLSELLLVLVNIRESRCTLQPSSHQKWLWRLRWWYWRTCWDEKQWKRFLRAVLGNVSTKLKTLESIINLKGDKDALLRYVFDYQLTKWQTGRIYRVDYMGWGYIHLMRWHSHSSCQRGKIAGWQLYWQLHYFWQPTPRHIKWLDWAGMA